MSNKLPGDFFDDLKTELSCLDPVLFVEQKLTIRDEPFSLVGREYLHEPYRYICLEATGKTGIPVVVVKGRQVEFTTTAAALSLYFMCSGVYSSINGLHAFPAVETARRHSNGPYDTFVSTSVGSNLVKLKNLKTYSVTEKHYITNNTLYIDSTSKDGDRLRGLPIDFCFFDEVQDMTTAARENTQQALNHSIFGSSGTGLEVYFGTPKNAGSDFEALWEASDQRYYNLRCPHCQQLMPITLNNYKTGYMVECDFCHKLYDKTMGIKHGKWVPTRQGWRRGYHISQLLVPYITREAIARKQDEMTPRGFKNEVLGEFYTGTGEAPSLPEIIKWMTTDPDSSAFRMSKNVLGRTTYMGIDWGGRIAGEDDQGTGGYTIVTVISVDELSKKFYIEFAHRMTTKNLDEQIAQISKWITEFNCSEIVADVGYGHAACQRLQEKWAGRFKACYSSGNTKKTYAYSPETNMITVHKDQAVEELYDDIERFRFIAPYAEPERIEWLFEHLSNIDIVTATINGMARKKYRKQGPARAIDGVMSLMYARIAWKFKQSRGFNDTVTGTHGGGRSFPLTTTTGNRLSAVKTSSARMYSHIAAPTGVMGGRRQAFPIGG